MSALRTRRAHARIRSGRFTLGTVSSDYYARQVLEAWQRWSDLIERHNGLPPPGSPDCHDADSAVRRMRECAALRQRAAYIEGPQ